MNVKSLKLSQLEHVARHREKLHRAPHLRWLFFEITNQCNLQCRHCASSCASSYTSNYASSFAGNGSANYSSSGQFLTVEEIKTTLQSITFDQPVVCLTGGEPMLHPDFFSIAHCVQSMGFPWGMTTNATLITDGEARKLRQAGLASVSVSLDGMEQAHDELRQQKGAWRSALRGLRALQDAGFKPQVTTVLHQKNFQELENLYAFLEDMGITSWRPINVEPIGRACESADLHLTPEQFSHLLAFIRDKRFNGSRDMEVTFGCSHYLGVEYERMVRDHYFLCGAGILTASVRSNGDICACLDIANRPELVQGNIKTDYFQTVWQERFQVFRRDRTADCAKCISCPERFLCGGDATHTWDYEKRQPLLCYQDYQPFLR